MLTKIDTKTAREHFAEILNRVAYGHEEIILTRHGKPIAAVISIEGFHRLSDVKPRTPITPKVRS